MSGRTERWTANASKAPSLRSAVRRGSFCVSLAALLLPAVSCGHKPADAQALRTCVDRWNQGNMVGWGPGPVNVAFRRPKPGSAPASGCPRAACASSRSPQETGRGPACSPA